MKRTLTAVYAILVCITLSGFPVKITSWQLREDIKKLNALNVSIDYVNQETQTIIVYVPDETALYKLMSNGFAAKRIPDLAKAYADSLWEATKDSDDPMRAYYTWTEFIAFMQNTANQNPDICELVQFGTSVQNRPLYYIKISDNVTQQENEPEFRYISSIHGDEVVGYDLLIRLIQLLTSQYGSNARITNIVDNTELWICPMLNPDGYVAHSRYNSNMVDLNRNFPMPAAGSLHPDGLAWQPETESVMNHGADNNIILSANLHGGALVVNYPWDYTYTLAPDNDLIIQAALSYASNNSSMYNSTEFPQGITNGAQWYVVSGSLQDWSYGFSGAVDLTIEIGYNKWPPSTQLDTYWNLNQESLLSLIEFSQKGLHGTVTNSEGTPLEAWIAINNNGIDIETDPQLGDYHRMLLPGTYSVTAYASGYQSATAEIVIPPNTSVIHDFVLSLAPVTDLFGSVIDLSGAPVAGATVQLILYHDVHAAMTDASGNFTFNSIPQDTYDIIINSSGHGIYNNTFQLDSERQIFVLPEPLFLDDFEAGIGNWNLQSPWSIVNHNGELVLTDSPIGNYGNNLNISAALSNPVSLANVTNATLSFDLKHSLENNYDFLFVYASANGTDWFELAYFTGINQIWQNYTYSLQNYEDGNLYLKFILSTDASVTADGVYIDNVMVSGLSSVQTVYGDTDANWILNNYDIHNILEYSVSNDPIPLIDSYPWSDFRLEAADVDNDNRITATDAYYIYDRLSSYSSAFPAQGGLDISFTDPFISICIYNEYINLDFAHIWNLKSMTMNFSNDYGLDFTSITWYPNVQNFLYAMNLSNNTLSVLCLADPDVNYTIATIHSNNISQYTHCTGIVNDTDCDMDIHIISNQDDFINPISTELLGNYPNPFNPETTIRFSIAKDNTTVRLQVYNIKGQLITTLIDSDYDKGYHNVIFEGIDGQNKSLGNGIYFYRLETPDQVFTQKMVILK